MPTKRNPRVCDAVCYYDQGTGAAKCAMVQAYNGSILDLTIWGKNVLVPQCKGGVRHRDDPWNKERPERLRENGCWDWPENEEERRRAERDQRDAERAFLRKAEEKKRNAKEADEKKEPVGSRAFPGRKQPATAST